MRKYHSVWHAVRTYFFLKSTLPIGGRSYEADLDGLTNGRPVTMGESPKMQEFLTISLAMDRALTPLTIKTFQTIFEEPQLTPKDVCRKYRWGMKTYYRRIEEGRKKLRRELERRGLMHKDMLGEFT